MNTIRRSSAMTAKGKSFVRNSDFMGQLSAVGLASYSPFAESINHSKHNTL